MFAGEDRAWEAPKASIQSQGRLAIMKDPRHDKVHWSRSTTASSDRKLVWFVVSPSSDLIGLVPGSCCLEQAHAFTLPWVIAAVPLRLAPGPRRRPNSCGPPWSTGNAGNILEHADIGRESIDSRYR